MPTKSTHGLEDLVAERESLMRHEQMLVAEHHEKMRALRARLLALDKDIVRLGGTARDDTSSPEDDAALLASLSLVPSVAPFPNDDEEGGDATEPKKKSRGRKRKADDDDDYDGNDGGAKKRGRKKKDTGGKENASSNSPEKPAKGARKKRGGRKSSAAAAASDDPVDPTPWTCQCGEELPATRTRCGKCKRWRGGKRGKRWSCKPKEGGEEGKAAKSGASSGKGNAKKAEASADAAPVEGKPKAEVSTAPSSKAGANAKETIAPAASKPEAKAENGAALSSKPKALVERNASASSTSSTGSALSVYENIPMRGTKYAYPRAEIKAVMSRMVSAVASVPFLGETGGVAEPSAKPKPGRRWMSRRSTSEGSSSNSSKASGEAPQKKRGRPKKAKVETGAVPSPMAEPNVQSAVDGLQALMQPPRLDIDGLGMGMAAAGTPMPAEFDGQAQNAAEDFVLGLLSSAIKDPPSDVQMI